MISIPLYIKECIDVDFIDVKQGNYSYAFHKLYANNHKTDDKKFANYIQKKYAMTDIEFRSLQSDVANKFEQTNTNKQNQEERIMNTVYDLKEACTKEKSNKTTRTKFKKHNKIKQLECSLPQNITFGGKQNLRELTRLHNNIQVIKKEKNTVVRNNLLIENGVKLREKTDLWKQKRILPFYILGEANQKGNRFFHFDFINNTIIYKPYKGKKVEIKYSCGNKYQNDLLKLQELIDNKIIPVTITITKNKVCISFDNEVFSGYYVDKKERKKEVDEINKKNFSKKEKTDIIKDIYKKYYAVLKAQKLVGKIEKRYIAVDLNPDYIGYCIADKGVDGIENIVEKGVIGLRKLNEKLGFSSDNSATIHQNNKRRFEIQNAWKELFNIANHYRCAYFIKEDIDNIGKNESFENKEANRKVKNIWHREITNWQIEKRCITYGIELLGIIPVYTSFIGNLMYNNFDATNSAIEICRRGMFKFEKGLFYPTITGTISDTMSKFFEQQNVQLKPRDVQTFKDCKQWDKLYKIASDNGLRWRWDWNMVEKSFSVFSMKSINSKVTIVRFSDDCL